MHDYVDQVENFASLYSDVTECDKVLDQMQGLLQNFQQELSGISKEIKHLQDESLNMNIKLRNRKAAGVRLHTPWTGEDLEIEIFSYIDPSFTHFTNVFYLIPVN